ncbi:hypothetical protein F4776DRAFT_657856 [Hypoxylon sp. NC0597]|nr:hypothetical protein F4776DRAFT_657856 [Hypoxylon sp. NC0597]
MSDVHLYDTSSAVGGTPNMLRRRKIRKGTQSCWECKRRKIRCTFAAPTDAICDGCKSRQTTCISQEFDDEVIRGRKLDRVSRMELLVEQLVKQSNVDLPGTLNRDEPHQDKVLQPVLSPSIAIATYSSDIDSQVNSDLDRLSHELLAIWPSQHDLDLILSVPIGASVLLHGLVCQPYSRLVSSQVTSPRLLLQPPSRGSHPILIARKLLLLSSLLQGIPPCSVSELIGLSSDYSVIMSRLFNTATKLVTSHDELISSVEGVECVMIESMYLNKAGNLRRAWLANRRAMAMAQLLELHVGTTSPNVFLQKETWDRIDPHYMWFRLIVSDRYLSLMLGLPQGSPETVFPNLDALENCVPLERMERMEVVAAGLILQRNGAERTNLVATCKIDQILQEAAALMPPQWWLITSDLGAIDGNDEKAFEESIRLTNQFAHHHLLLQLHLPYMMLPSTAELSYDYSKMTAAGASRTILGQFVAFRNSMSSIAYCRGIDFIAFIASTTLCIAHIEARRQRGTDASKSAPAFQSLRHQRLSDRGLLERALEVMETMAHRNHDVVAKKISSILRPLLVIESNSFRGDCYHIYASSEADKQDPQCIGETSGASHTLRIQIPYFGTIHIEHRPALSNTATWTQMPSEELHWNHTQPVNTDWQAIPPCFDPDGSIEQSESVNSMSGASKEQDTYLLVPGLEADVDDWALQGVDMALFRNLTQASAGFTSTQ